MDRFSRNGSAVERSDSGLQVFMSQVYGWMSVGLVLTGFVALFASNSPAIMNAIFNTPLVYVLIVAQLGLVFVLSGLVHKMSGSVATSVFMLYSILTGLTLSSIFMVYTSASITSTFFITAGMFGAMSFYGYSTKRDLTGIGNMLFMGLIGILIASVVNIFMKSPALYWAISYLGVAIFAGLTAYDTQKLKAMGETLDPDDRDTFRKYSIMGALSLYLDFINLFLMLLRILGDRR